MAGNSLKVSKNFTFQKLMITSNWWLIWLSNCIDLNQILHTVKGHQIHFMDDPNVHNNSKMVDCRRVEKLKMAISQQQFD